MIYSIIPYQRIGELSHHYSSSNQVSSLTDVIYSTLGDVDTIGRKLLNHLEITCETYHINCTIPTIKWELREVKEYEDAFLETATGDMSESDMQFRMKNVSLAKERYEEAEEHYHALKAVSVLSHDGEDKASVQLEIYRGRMDSQYALWNSGAQYLDNHQTKMQKIQLSLLQKALKQHGEDSDAIDREATAKGYIKKILMTMLKTCPSSITKLLMNLGNDGEDPFQDNDFYTLVNRLKKKFGSVDEFSTTSILVKAIGSTMAPGMTLAEWNETCIQLGRTMNLVIPTGVLTCDTLLAVIILKGMHREYLEKYLTAMSQIQISKHYADESGFALDGDDALSIQSGSSKVPALLTCVQEFIESEIRRQHVSETMSLLSINSSNVAIRKVNSPPIVVCSTSAVLSENTLTLLDRYNVCQAEYVQYQGCSLGVKCPGHHFSKENCGIRKAFCGLYLMGTCTRGDRCPYSHIASTIKGKSFVPPTPSVSTTNRMSTPKPSKVLFSDPTTVLNIGHSTNWEDGDETNPIIFSCLIPIESSTNDLSSTNGDIVSPGPPVVESHMPNDYSSTGDDVYPGPPVVDSQFSTSSPIDDDFSYSVGTLDSRFLPTMHHQHSQIDPTFRIVPLPSRSYSTVELESLFLFLHHVHRNFTKGDHHNKFQLLKSAYQYMLRDNSIRESNPYRIHIIHAYLDYLQRIHINDFLVCVPSFHSQYSSRYGTLFSTFMLTLGRTGHVRTFQLYLDRFDVLSLPQSPTTISMHESTTAVDIDSMDTDIPCDTADTVSIDSDDIPCLLPDDRRSIDSSDYNYIDVSDAFIHMAIEPWTTTEVGATEELSIPDSSCHVTHCLTSIMLFLSYIHSTPQMLYDISPYMVLARSLQLTKADHCIPFHYASNISIQYYLNNLSVIIPSTTVLQTILGMVCYKYGFGFHHHMCIAFGDTGIGAQFSIAMQTSLDTGSDQISLNLTPLYRVCFPIFAQEPTNYFGLIWNNYAYMDESYMIRISNAINHFYYDLISGYSNSLTDNEIQSCISNTPGLDFFIYHEGTINHHQAFWNTILCEEVEYAVTAPFSYNSFFNDPYVQTMRIFYDEASSSSDYFLDMLLLNTAGYPSLNAISELCTNVCSRYFNQHPRIPASVFMIQSILPDDTSEYTITSPVYSSHPSMDDLVSVTSPIYSMSTELPFDHITINTMPDTITELSYPTPSICTYVAADDPLPPSCSVRVSPLLRIDPHNGFYNNSIGNGLFADHILPRGSTVAVFSGELINLATRLQREREGHGGKMMAHNKTTVLDCYNDHGLAPFANSPLHLLDPRTNVSAVANCKLIKGTRLRACHIQALHDILPGEEILYAYGHGYRMPDIVPKEIFTNVLLHPAYQDLHNRFEQLSNEHVQVSAHLTELRDEILHLLSLITTPGSRNNPIDLTMDDIIPTINVIKMVDSSPQPPPVFLSTPSNTIDYGWDSMSGIHVVGTEDIIDPISPTGPLAALGIGGLTRITEQGRCPSIDPNLIFHRIQGNKENILSLGSALQPTIAHPLGGFAFFSAKGACRGNLTPKTKQLFSDLLDSIASDESMTAYATMRRNVYYQSIPRSSSSTISPNESSTSPIIPVCSIASVPHSLFGNRIRVRNSEQLVSFLNSTGLSKACIVSAISKNTIIGLPPTLTIANVTSYYQSIGKNKSQLLADIVVPALVAPWGHTPNVFERVGDTLIADNLDAQYSRMRPIITQSDSTTVTTHKGSLKVVPAINGGFIDSVIAYEPKSGYVMIKGRVSTASPHLIITHFCDIWQAKWNCLTTLRTDSAFITKLSVDLLAKRTPPVNIIQAPPGDHRRVTSGVEGIIRWIQQIAQGNMNRLKSLVKNGLISEHISRSCWYYATCQAIITSNMQPSLHDPMVSRYEVGTGLKANLSTQVLLPFGLPIIGKSIDNHADGRGTEGIYLGPSTHVPGGIIFLDISSLHVSIKSAFIPIPSSIVLSPKELSTITTQLFGSPITLLPEINSTSITSVSDVGDLHLKTIIAPPVISPYQTRSSTIRDHMVNIINPLFHSTPVFILTDESIIDLSTRGPKPIIPSNKVCMNDPLWADADAREIAKLLEAKTFMPLSRSSDGGFIRPSNALVLPLIRVREYKWKPDPITSIPRWLQCVRLVVDGSQDHRVLGDFYAHTPDRTLLLLIFSGDCICCAVIFSGDVVRAYLNAKSMDPNIVVLAPKDIQGLARESLLIQGLYGSRKAALGWEQWIEHKIVSDFAFHKLDVARGVYIHPFSETGEITSSRDPDAMNDYNIDTSALMDSNLSIVDTPEPISLAFSCGHATMLRHSDDLYLSSINPEKIHSLINHIEKGIKMTPFSCLSQFLGIIFTRYDSNGTINMTSGSIAICTQKDFIKELVIKFSYVRSIFNPRDTKRNHPIPLNAIRADDDLDADQICPLNAEQIRLFQEIVGSINWLACSTRPDVKFGCFVVSRQLACPRNWDMFLAVHIIDFLINTIDIPLVLGGSSFDPILYADASFATMPDKRSVCAHLVLSNNQSGCIYAHVNAPKCAVTSIFEAELIAGNNAATTAVYITKACTEMHYNIPHQRTIYIDNEAEVHWLSGSVSNKRSKHVDIRLYASRHLQEQGHVIFKFISTELQLADILTKALSVPMFWYLGYMLMGHALIGHFNIPGVQLYK